MLWFLVPFLSFVMLTHHKGHLQIQVDRCRWNGCHYPCWSISQHVDRHLSGRDCTLKKTPVSIWQRSNSCLMFSAESKACLFQQEGLLVPVKTKYMCADVWHLCLEMNPQQNWPCLPQRQMHLLLSFCVHVHFDPSLVLCAVQRSMLCQCYERNQNNICAHLPLVMRFVFSWEKLTTISPTVAPKTFAHIGAFLCCMTFSTKNIAGVWQTRLNCGNKTLILRHKYIAPRDYPRPG